MVHYLGSGVTLVAACAGLIFLRLHKHKRRLEYLKRRRMHKIHLSDYEKNMLFTFPPVSFMSLFQGSTKMARKYLETRVSEIIRANPWLASQIERDENGEITFYYPEYVSTVNRFYEHAPVSFLSKTKAYDEIVQELKNTSCRSGPESLGNGEPLWKITLVPDAKIPEDRFAIVASLNHCLMDGHAMYKVFNMLSVDSSVESLNPTRPKGCDTKIKEKLGNEKNVFEMWGFAVLAVLRVVFKPFLPGRKFSVYELSSEWIAAKKDEAVREGDVKFVSTNDVIFSAFSNNLNRCDVSMMAVSFRDRIPEFSQNVAWNCVSGISYTAQDFASPALIRKSITSPTLIRAAAPKTKMPSNFDIILSAKMALVSNWAGFGKQIVLNGSKELLHIPLPDWPEEVPVDVGIIFRLGEGKLGILSVVEKPSAKKLETCGLLLKQLSL